MNHPLPQPMPERRLNETPDQSNEYFHEQALRQNEADENRHREAAQLKPNTLPTGSEPPKTPEDPDAFDAPEDPNILPDLGADGELSREDLEQIRKFIGRNSIESIVTVKKYDK